MLSSARVPRIERTECLAAATVTTKGLALEVVG
jgi:hypothetical protein